MNGPISEAAGAAGEETDALKPHERIEYSAIVDRPPLRLPGRARLVVWPVVNVEEWDITRPLPRGVSVPPGGAVRVPDVQNWGWHEYGMRVGIWRLMESLARHRIPATIAINARVCETRPRIARAALAAGWEFMAHSYVQMPIHELADQRATMRQCIEVIRRFAGRAPAGWLGPGRGQTYATPDYIAEAGFRYFGDWVMDDQPFYVNTRHGPLVALPYSVELNDITIMLTGRQESDALFKRARDAFDQLYREAARGARVLAFGVHPYISGAAHRIRYFDAMLAYFKKKGVLFWTGEQICDWYRAQVPA